MSPTTPRTPSESGTSADTLAGSPARGRGRGVRGGLAWGNMLQAGIWLIFLAYPAYLILREDLTGVLDEADEALGRAEAADGYEPGEYPLAPSINPQFFAAE